MWAPGSNEEWDRTWSDYDGSAVLPEPSRAPRAWLRGCSLRAAARIAAAGLLALLLIGAMTLPVGDAGTSGPAPAQASLAPDEDRLPPLSVVIERLAAQSPDAACWVLALQPQAGGCAAKPLTR